MKKVYDDQSSETKSSKSLEMRLNRRIRKSLKRLDKDNFDTFCRKTKWRKRISNRVSSHELIEFASMASHFATRAIKVIKINYTQKHANMSKSSNSESWN